MSSYFVRAGVGLPLSGCRYTTPRGTGVSTPVPPGYLSRARTFVRLTTLALFSLNTVVAQSAEICGLQNAIFDSIFFNGFNGPSGGGLGPPYGNVNAPATGIAPTIAITSPSGGSLAGGHVQITGTVTGPPNVGVVVNGERAYVHNGAFLTRTLTLDLTETQLSAVATTPDGLTTSTSNAVTMSAGEPDATLTADAEVGFAPLPVRFSVRLRSGLALTIQSISVDYSTDGTPDYTGVGPVPLTTFVNAGIYTATADLTLSDNSHRVVTRKTIALDLAEQRENICSVYANLRARLAVQDASGAARSLTGPLYVKLSAFFVALGTQMPTVAAGLGTLADGIIGLDGADVVTVRDVSGTLRGYPVHFTRDASGIWRIDAM